MDTPTINNLNDLRFKDYHLYLSKESKLRRQIISIINQSINHLSVEEPEKSIYSFIRQVKSTEIYDEKKRQCSYSIIDTVLLYFLDYENFQDIIDVLFNNFRSYIVLHELAALGWGDDCIPPDFIFKTIEAEEVSEKHTYHILNEMSTRFPEETIEFSLKLISDQKLKPQTFDKLIDKMIESRKADRTLAKGVELQKSAEDIEKIIDDRK